MVRKISLIRKARLHHFLLPFLFTTILLKTCTIFHNKSLIYLLKNRLKKFNTYTYLSMKKNSSFVWFYIDVQIRGRDDYRHNEYRVPALLQSQVTSDHLRGEEYDKDISSLWKQGLGGEEG